MSKVLGAIYRIPLTNILGGEGMGIYQMVYPLYCILLTVSASGIPTGIARLVSSGRGFGAEKQAFRLYGAVGIIGTFVMYMLAAPLAAVQGEPAIALCCKLLCPSVFFVSMLSVVRGYFQGKGNMYPTAVTEVSEQLIKVGVGVALSYAFRSNLALAVASTLFAVTVSEVLATAFAVIWYFRRKAKKPLYTPAYVPVKSILRYTIPLTLTAIAMPVSQLAESIIAVRLLRIHGGGNRAIRRFLRLRGHNHQPSRIGHLRARRLVRSSDFPPCRKRGYFGREKEGFQSVAYHPCGIPSRGGGAVRICPACNPSYFRLACRGRTANFNKINQNYGSQRRNGKPRPNLVRVPYLARQAHKKHRHPVGHGNFARRAHRRANQIHLAFHLRRGMGGKLRVFGCHFAKSLVYYQCK